jgi:CRP-like cAMP-binding protein
MATRIFNFFESYIRADSLFSDEEIAVIKCPAIPKRLKKKEYLLHEGDICRFHAFVCSGCLRSYRIDDNGREHIFSLSPASHWVSDPVSLATRRPTTEFIDALKDSVTMEIRIIRLMCLSLFSYKIGILLL